MKTSSCVPLTLAVWLLASTGAGARDWPQFRGPRGDGIGDAAGLARSWPDDGPTEVWRRPLGEGFAGLTVAGEQLYTLFAEDGHEWAAAFRVTDGSEVWRHRLGEVFVDHWGNGPRATPAVAGDIVYVLGSNGAMAALSTSNGKPIWEVDLEARFGNPAEADEFDGGVPPGHPDLGPYWGFCSSPLVEGDQVVVYTGSGGGNSLVALDKTTGETRWSRLDHASSYSSPLAVTLGGQRQIVVAMANEIVSVSLAGKLFWRYPWARFNVSQPVFMPPDKLFFSAPNDVGAVLLEIRGDDDGFTVEEVWRQPRMRNNWQSSLAYQGSIVGFDNATLKALSANDGEVTWAQRRLGKGTLVLADDLLFIVSDRGVVTLAEWSLEGFEQTGQRPILTGTTMTAPSVAQGKLFLRDHEQMVCLDLKPATATDTGDEP